MDKLRKTSNLRDILEAKLKGVAVVSPVFSQKLLMELSGGCRDKSFYQEFAFTSALKKADYISFVMSRVTEPDLFDGEFQEIKISTTPKHSDVMQTLNKWVSNAGSTTPRFEEDADEPVPTKESTTPRFDDDSSDDENSFLKGKKKSSTVHSTSQPPPPSVKEESFTLENLKSSKRAKAAYCKKVWSSFKDPPPIVGLSPLINDLISHGISKEKLRNIMQKRIIEVDPKLASSNKALTYTEFCKVVDTLLEYS